MLHLMQRTASSQRRGGAHGLADTPPELTKLLLSRPEMLAQCTYSEGALFPFAGQAGRVCLMAGLLAIW